MSRATNDDVLAIMVNTNLTANQLTPFLDAASSIVTATMTTEYGDTLLDQIETWLAAHFAEGADPSVTEEKVGDASVKFGGRLGEGLASTRYGQRVRLLDYKGILSGFDKDGGRAFVEAIL